MAKHPRLLGLSLAACLLLGAAPTAQAAALDPQQVPKTAKWVVHLDADRAKASVVGTALIDELLGRPEAQEGLDRLLRLAGFALPKDLHGITLYGTAFGEEHNVVLVQGAFDSNRILGVLELAPSYTNESYDAKEIVSWDDKGKTMYGAFLREDLIVIARSADRVKLAVDVMEKKAPPFTAMDNAAPLGDAGVLAYMEGSGLAELAKAGQASPVVRNAQSAWLAVGEDDGKQIFVRGHVEAPDAQGAQRLLRAGEGIRAIVSMRAAQEDADERIQLIDELLTKLQLKQTERGLDLSLATPAQKVVDVIKQGIAHVRPEKK